MTASPGIPELSDKAAALCKLFSTSTELRRPGVQESAERARDLLRSGAGADELAACYDDLDHALRVAGDAQGLAGHARGATAPGLAPHTKVAVCPGPARCSRLHVVRYRLPAAHCAVNDARMHKARLEPEQ
ncbi:hypothetical protein OG230_35390 [Streptomyces sp. NBC_00234]|uniref:hypothetical protein n=1 Tax=Streptomyces sp. NBC_00234 TaxID=2903638 RepID=UPI002E2D163B|nr:hypothetical protein [Streptomyces sp. NBC_00234]